MGAMRREAAVGEIRHGEGMEPQERLWVLRRRSLGGLPLQRGELLRFVFISHDIHVNSPSESLFLTFTVVFLMRFTETTMAVIKPILLTLSLHLITAININMTPFRTFSTTVAFTSRKKFPTAALPV